MTFERAKFPPKRFSVEITVSSIKRSPEYIEEILGIKATRVRHANDSVRKYNIWQIEADWSIETIQEQIDSVLSQVAEHTEKFRMLEDCGVFLAVVLFHGFKESRGRLYPSFDISDEQIALLHSMNASFMVD